MNPPFLPFLIPIIAIVLGCSIPLLAIYVQYRKRKEMFALYHQERMAAIEKGIELPPLPEHFFQDGQGGARKRSPHHDFGVGLFWLLLGLALMIALYFNDKGAVALYALIPVAIGLAYLIFYAVVGKKEAAKVEAERAKVNPE